MNLIDFIGKKILVAVGSGGIALLGDLCVLLDKAVLCRWWVYHTIKLRIMQ